MIQKQTKLLHAKDLNILNVDSSLWQDAKYDVISCFPQKSMHLFSVIVAPDADSLLDILESDPQSDWSNSPGPRQTGSLIWLSLALIKTAGLIRTGYVCHRFERLDMIIGWLSLQTKLAIAAKYKGLPFLQKSVRTGIWENIRSVGKVCVTVGENSLDKQERVILH